MRVKRSDLNAFEHLPNPAWVFDFDFGKTWYANRHALELFGVSNLKGLQAINLRDPLTDGMRRRVERLFEHFRHGESQDEEWTFYPEGKAPIYTTCTMSGITIEDEAGTRLAMLVQGRRRRDVDTKERRLVEALQHCNERLSLYGSDGHLLLRNPAAEQAFGIVAEKIDLFTASFSEVEDAKVAKRTAEAGNVFRKRVAVSVVQGKAWYDTEVRQVVDPVSGSKALLCVQHDVTEEYLNERQLDDARQEALQLRSRAEAANRAKTVFLAAMSHDLRTPMTGVLAAAQLLSTSELNDEQGEFLDMVVEGGEQMVALVDDILDLSRIEAGHIELTLTRVSLNRVIEGTLRPLRAAAQRKGLSLRYQVNGEQDLEIEVDERRLRQVLTNLVSNAIKFSEAGTISIIANTRRNADMPSVRFEVHDQGIGLDPLTADHLFEPFNRGHHSTAQSGSGLGLHIARSIVHAMSGTIGMVPNAEQGCTFWIELQFSTTKNTTKQTPLPQDKQPLRLRILVVDDNSLNRRAMSRVLANWGCQVVTAFDGEDALQQLDPSFDVVLMDINMPRKNGLSAAQEIRARSDKQANVPIIALTADVFFQVQQSPFNQTLHKPLDWDALRTALQSLT